MIAYIKVVDSPYFAKTDAAGVAHIELPPAAKYSVSAWHYHQSAAAAPMALALKADAALAFKLAMKPELREPGAATDY
jgi:hypothetical protein